MLDSVLPGGPLLSGWPWGVAPPGPVRGAASCVARAAARKMWPQRRGQLGRAARRHRCAHGAAARRGSLVVSGSERASSGACHGRYRVSRWASDGCKPVGPGGLRRRGRLLSNLLIVQLSLSRPGPDQQQLLAEVLFSVSLPDCHCPSLLDTSEKRLTAGVTRDLYNETLCRLRRVTQRRKVRRAGAAAIATNSVKHVTVTDSSAAGVTGVRRRAAAAGAQGKQRETTISNGGHT